MNLSTIEKCLAELPAGGDELVIEVRHGILVLKGDEGRKAVRAIRMILNMAASKQQKGGVS